VLLGVVLGRGSILIIGPVAGRARAGHGARHRLGSAPPSGPIRSGATCGASDAATWLLTALSTAAAFAAVTFGAAARHLVPALTTAWTPRLPALLTSGGGRRVRAGSGDPGRPAMGIRKSATRAFTLACGARDRMRRPRSDLPLALHRAHPLMGRVGLGWLAWARRRVGSGRAGRIVFLALTRLRPSLPTWAWCSSPRCCSAPAFGLCGGPLALLGVPPSRRP